VASKDTRYQSDNLWRERGKKRHYPRYDKIKKWRWAHETMANRKKERVVRITHLRIQGGEYREMHGVSIKSGLRKERCKEKRKLGECSAFRSKAKKGESRASSKHPKNAQESVGASRSENRGDGKKQRISGKRKGSQRPKEIQRRPFRGRKKRVARDSQILRLANSSG